jgi:hypothetical protein
LLLKVLCVCAELHAEEMHFFSSPAACLMGHVLLVYLIIRNAPLLFYPAACFSLVFNLPVVTARKILTGFFEFLGWPFCTRRVRAAFSHTQRERRPVIGLFELWARQFGPCNYLFQCDGSLSDFRKGQISVSEIQFGKTPIVKIYIQHDSTTLFALFFAQAMKLLIIGFLITPV